MATQPTCARRSVHTGPDNLTRSPARRSECTQRVTRPPGTMRMFNSTSAAADGGLASEKARQVFSPGHMQVDVLPGLKAHAAGIVEADPHPFDGGRQVFDAADRAFKIPHRQILCIGLDLDIGFDRQIRLQGGAAG